MRKMRKNMTTRALSPIISVVLLISIVLSASSVLYYLVMVRTASMAPEPVEAKAELSIDDYRYSGGVLTLYVRNIGLNADTIDVVYIDGRAVMQNINQDISPGEVVTLTISVSLTSGSHRVRVATVKGVVVDDYIVVS